MDAVDMDGKSPYDRQDNMYPRPSSFSRALKGVALLVTLVLVFSYTTWTFAKSGAIVRNKQMPTWRVNSLTQTEIIVNTQKLTQGESASLKHNSRVPLSQPDSAQPHPQNVTQGTGPLTRPPTMNKHNDSSISSTSSTNKGSDEDEKIQTLFATLQFSYTDIKLGKNNGIPTVQFLDVSQGLKPLLDAVGSSVSLIEGDIGGNAKKLRKCYDENPNESQTIQDMLTFDIKMGRAKEDKRSVISLTWFKRAYEFIKRLMIYIANGAEVYEAARTAYEEVLSKHHGFFVRTSFKAAMNLLPYRHNFLKKLVVNEADLARPDWEAQVTADMKQYFLGMENILSILRDFFTENHLEN